MKWGNRLVFICGTMQYRIRERQSGANGGLLIEYVFLHLRLFFCRHRIGHTDCDAAREPIRNAYLKNGQGRRVLRGLSKTPG